MLAAIYVPWHRNSLLYRIPIQGNNKNTATRKWWLVGAETENEIAAL